MNDPQKKNIDRVRDRISACVEAFWAERMGGDPVFTATELRTYVESRHPGIAPDSPSRILRVLRQAGRVNYVLESRAASRYRATAVTDDDAPSDPAD